jgi:hypothetical protein
VGVRNVAAIQVAWWWEYFPWSRLDRQELLVRGSLVRGL